MLLLNTWSMNRFSRYCYAQGLAVVVVGYPAVAFDGVRARFCMSAAHSEEQVYTALKIIEGALTDGVVPRYCVPRAVSRARYEEVLFKAPMGALPERLAPIAEQPGPASPSDRTP